MFQSILNEHQPTLFPPSPWWVSKTREDLLEQKNIEVWQSKLTGHETALFIGRDLSATGCTEFISNKFSRGRLHCNIWMPAYDQLDNNFDYLNLTNKYEHKNIVTWHDRKRYLAAVKPQVLDFVIDYWTKNWSQFCKLKQFLKEERESKSCLFKSLLTF